MVQGCCYSPVNAMGAGRAFHPAAPEEVRDVLS